MSKAADSIWVSWNENIKHPYKQLHRIHSEEELIKIVTTSNNIRFFGNRQSSADISAGAPTLMDITAYNKILAYNENERLITVQSGIKLNILIQAIEQKGWCIPCLPDIDTVTLGGALATGTHGTSGKLLSEYVVACRFVMADGSVKEVCEGEELMDALRVSIGVLGILSSITIKCEPLYTLHVKEGPQKDKVWLNNWKSELQKHDFLRILWLPHTGHGYVITGDKIPFDTKINEKKGPWYLKYRRSVSTYLYKHAQRFPWLTPMANKVLYLAFFSTKKESKGSLYEATVTKSRGATLELAEWTIGVDKFQEVFSELKTEINKRNNNAFVHIPMDIRFVYNDNSWLSNAYKQDTVTIGCVTRNAASANDYHAFKVIEQVFIKHGGRPHWGKRFEAKDSEMMKLYPKWNDFKKLRKEFDPTNKFLNPYLTSLFNEPSKN